MFLPGESQGQRSLVGCGPWGRTELDTTEVTWHARMHGRRKWQRTPVVLPGESRGRAWWAAVYGVAQSPIRLKRLSSSSSSKAVLDSAWGHENMYGPRHSPALREPCRIFLTQKWGRNNFRVFVSLSLSPKMWLTFSWVKINSSCPVDLFAQLSGPPLALYSPGLCFMKSSRTKHSVLHIGKMFSACVCVCVIFDNLFQ